MVKVPTYQGDARLRPAYQQGVNVRADDTAFGGGVARGLSGLARGVGQASEAAQALRDLDDMNAAKEADNAFASWARERMYGEGGFLTLEGRNAVDARAKFEEEAAAKRQEFGRDLTPGASRSYGDASNARLQSVLQQSIVHTAQARKKWTNDAATARLETFANDALVGYRDPAMVTKNIAAGLAEMRGQAQLNGWDAATLSDRERDYTSGVHKNIALRLAQDDPLAAEAYIAKNADAISGAEQYDLRRALEPEIKNEKSKREADAILGMGRTAPGASAGAGRTVGDTGPTMTRSFLTSRLASGHGAEHVDNLQDSFAQNLAALMQDAPPEIREGLQIGSGFRSVERQRELWEASDKTGRTVAAPGRSQHNFGNAVDLHWNGMRLDKAPASVRAWVHQNAAAYGLRFPMSYEPWHIEPVGARDGGATVVPRSDAVSPRASMPSYDEIEGRLAQISDPDVRELTRKRIYAGMEASSKAREEQERQAKATLWQYVDQGMTPDQVPMDVRQAAGMASVSSAWSYIDAAAKRGEVVSDEGLLYEMRRSAAMDPVAFSTVDLNEYRDRLSVAAIKEMTDLQTTALTDQRKAREDGLVLTSAFSMASSQLEAVGITTTGKDGSARQEAAKREAAFQNALATEMEAFKAANGANPAQADIQKMVNRLLLPIVVKTPRGPANPAGWFGSDMSTQDGLFAFEAGSRADGTTVDVVVEYGDIPIDLRRGIARDLELELGRKPSEDEIVSRYEEVALSR